MATTATIDSHEGKASMKVWITKYALTVGITEEDAERCDTRPGMIKLTAEKHKWQPYVYGEGVDWHTTRESAVKRAEQMRQKKIASLRKHLAKLEAMRFE
jgi:hypothetical protein